MSLGFGKDKSESTNVSDTTTSGSQGGLNVSDDIKNQIMDALPGLVSGSGVQEMTPELAAAIAALTGGNTGQGMQQGGGSALGQAGGMLGGNQAISGQDVGQIAKDIFDVEGVKSGLSQLNKAAQESLTQSLGGIEQGAAATGGLGSSRTALAQGQAIGDSQEALANASQNLVNNAVQNAMQGAIGIAQGNQQANISAGSNLGQLGLGAMGMGNQQAQQNIDNLVKAGLITQEQANAMANKGLGQLGSLMDILGGLYGTQFDQSSHTEGKGTNTGSSSQIGFDWSKTPWGK